MITKLGMQGNITWPYWNQRWTERLD